MANALVLSTVATQLARTINDVVRATATASIATIAREGPSPHLLGLLVQSTADLVSNPPLVEGLAFSHTIEGSWTSAFMANFMGVQQKTTQQPATRNYALMRQTDCSTRRPRKIVHVSLYLFSQSSFELCERVAK